MNLKEAAEKLKIPLRKVEEWRENYEWLKREKITEMHINVLKRIQEFEKEGYTLAGIRRRLFEEFGPPMSHFSLLKIREGLADLLTFLRSNGNMH